MRSRTLVKLIEAFSELAPLSLAERSWDNVGVLIESRGFVAQNSALLLTIDVNHDVLDEAIGIKDKGNDLVILSYHPPIFKPIRSLTLEPTDEFYSHTNEIVSRSIQSGISIFSPHTALDNCHVNDWIASIIGSGKVVPIIPSHDCSETGAGRILFLSSKLSLAELLQKLMKGFGIKYARVAKPKHLDPKGNTLDTFAICAGAGSSVLVSSKEMQMQRNVQVLITGEMSHHNILAAVARGLVVILFEHTHTERKYLSHVLKPKLDTILKCSDIQVFVSTVDHDPIELYQLE